MTQQNAAFRPESPALVSDQVRNASVWLMFAISFFVFIEPAPVDILFFVVLIMFVHSGLSITIGAMPLLVLLLLYNLGGLTSFMQVANDKDAMLYTFTSVYMGMSALFMCFYVAHDPLARMRTIHSAVIFAGVVGSLCGLAEYFFTGAFFPHVLYADRAQGTFKDPNVFSTFLIFPAILALQSVITGNTRYPLLSAGAFIIMVLGIFLSFSRGAWINLAGASILLFTLTFLLNSNRQMRQRLLAIFIVGIALLSAGFVALMSIESIREVFLDRFTLVKSYDSGETGRFGRQINSLAPLSSLPLGFGPIQFRNYLREDPHNSFINAFSAYGWLGGISYFTLIICTIWIGIRTVFAKSAWQAYAIAVFCPLLTTILQSVQIDIDHWRHFYIMLGLQWGLFAATIQPTAVVGGLRAATRPFNPGDS